MRLFRFVAIRHGQAWLDMAVQVRTLMEGLGLVGIGSAVVDLFGAVRPGVDGQGVVRLSRRVLEGPVAFWSGSAVTVGMEAVSCGVVVSGLIWSDTVRLFGFGKVVTGSVWWGSIRLFR